MGPQRRSARPRGEPLRARTCREDPPAEGSPACPLRGREKGWPAGPHVGSGLGGRLPGSEAGRQETRGVAPLRGGGREQGLPGGKGHPWVRLAVQLVSLCGGDQTGRSPLRCPCAAAIRLDGHLSGDTDSGNKGGERAGPDRVKGAHLIAPRVPTQPCPPLRCLSPPLLQECGGGGTPLGRRGEEIY